MNQNTDKPARMEESTTTTSKANEPTHDNRDTSTGESESDDASEYRQLPFSPFNPYFGMNLHNEFMNNDDHESEGNDLPPWMQGFGRGRGRWRGRMQGQGRWRKMAAWAGMNPMMWFHPAMYMGLDTDTGTESETPKDGAGPSTEKDPSTANSENQTQNVNDQIDSDSSDSDSVIELETVKANNEVQGDGEGDSPGHDMKRGRGKGKGHCKGKGHGKRRWWLRQMAMMGHPWMAGTWNQCPKKAWRRAARQGMGKADDERKGRGQDEGEGRSCPRKPWKIWRRAMIMQQCPRMMRRNNMMWNQNPMMTQWTQGQPWGQSPMWNQGQPRSQGPMWNQGRTWGQGPMWNQGQLRAQGPMLSSCPPMWPRRRMMMKMMMGRPMWNHPMRAFGRHMGMGHGAPPCGPMMGGPRKQLKVMRQQVKVLKEQIKEKEATLQARQAKRAAKMAAADKPVGSPMENLTRNMREGMDMSQE